jgi:hypothetical protein
VGLNENFNFSTNKTNIFIIDDLFASAKDSSSFQNLFADESYLKKILGIIKNCKKKEK